MSILGTEQALKQRFIEGTHILKQHVQGVVISKELKLEEIIYINIYWKTFWLIVR